ncbi:MAG: HIT domain-containing protein [Nanoarchaeota archaeon]|mgnify:CR=1 FL=1
MVEGDRDECGLCQGKKEEYRLVRREKLVYAMIPQEPLVEGHLLLAPQRHGKLESLTGEELVQLRDLTVVLKERLVQLYPAAPPYLYSVMDTSHSSIPDHFHYHLLPGSWNLRKVLACYDSTIPERRRASRSELESLTRKIKIPDNK